MNTYLGKKLGNISGFFLLYMAQKLIAEREDEERAREKSLLRKRKLAPLDNLLVNKKAIFYNKCS